jgi:hypothetical protein
VEAILATIKRIEAAAAMTASPTREKIQDEFIFIILDSSSQF